MRRTSSFDYNGSVEKRHARKTARFRSWLRRKGFEVRARRDIYALTHPDFVEQRKRRAELKSRFFLMSSHLPIVAPAHLWDREEEKE